MERTSKRDDRPGGFYADGGHEYVADHFLHAVYFTEQTSDDKISMPSNDKNITEEQQTKVKASQAITLLLGTVIKLYYYDGSPTIRIILR